MEKANPALRRVEKRNFRMDETQCLRMIRASLAPSTGCTEPAAIALNAATARKAAHGTVTQVTARLDAYLFKNAMGVGIPGADERGVDLCVALGITAGDADAGMNALHTVTAEQLAAAKALRGCVKVEIVDGVSGLYIETILRTDCDAVRVSRWVRTIISPLSNMRRLPKRLPSRNRWRKAARTAGRWQNLSPLRTRLRWIN